MTETLARKSRLGRYLTIALILFLAPIFVFGATIAITGTITVQVHDRDGSQIYVPVPAILVDLAVLLAPLVIPDDALADARRQVAPYRPALESIADEIESCPSGVLVEVKGRDQHVQVRKTWRSLEVTVNGDDGDVYIKAPARLLSRALDVI